MITNCEIRIAAPADRVWAIFSDVERWAEWTASIQHVRALDGSGLAVGRRFAIKQPWLPTLEWAVTAIAPGASWTWMQPSPGARSVAVHEVMPQPDGTTLVRQRFEQRGPFGEIIGRLSAGLTRRYLQLEADGLKARAERQPHSHAASA